MADRVHSTANEAICQSSRFAAQGGSWRAYDTLDGRFFVRSAEEDMGDRSARSQRWNLLAAHVHSGAGREAMDATHMLRAHRHEDAFCLLSGRKPMASA